MTPQIDEFCVELVCTFINHIVIFAVPID